jgi:3',5'-cyclic AMP phosphodiesterase CpdA
LITLGHLSDLHATDPTGAGATSLLNKRFFGWLSWTINRHRHYQRHVAEAMFEDIQRESPDHVAVTGDLVNISLPHEFEAASRMLQKLGSAQWVTVVPGNHDAYVGVSVERAWALWADYLASDPNEGAVSENNAKPQNENEFSFPGNLPSVRIRGDLALVGVCSAIPTPPFVAAGKVGSDQLEQLEKTLKSLRERDLCRVVLVHHPVVDGHVTRRRRLVDSPELRAVLERAGADLVIHGHNHRSEFKALQSNEGTIPVVGVRSASYAGPNPEKTAQYHLYQIERAQEGEGARFKISLRTRGWNEQARTFEEVGNAEPLLDRLDA